MVTTFIVLTLAAIIIIQGFIMAVDVSKLQAAIAALKADRDAARAQLADLVNLTEAAKAAVAAEDQAQVDAVTATIAASAPVPAPAETAPTA